MERTVFGRFDNSCTPWPGLYGFAAGVSGERTRGTCRLARTVAVLIAVASCSLHCSALAADGAADAVELEHREIVESSGVAASHRAAGLLWTHNDSGDHPRLFCFDMQGRHRGIVDVEGATAVDWEDMASYTLDGQPKLLIADVGDNARRRPHVTLYEIDEPSPDTAERVRAARRWQVHYARGPRDCEAVAVDVTSNEILLADKSLLPHCRLWSVSLDAGDAGAALAGTVVAQEIGSLAIPLVTAMDVSADGRLMVLATYADAVLIARRRGADGRLEPWAAALRRPPIHLALPPRKQGEAVCFAGGQTEAIVLTSEKRPAPLIHVSLDSVTDRWRYGNEGSANTPEEGRP